MGYLNVDLIAKLSGTGGADSASEASASGTTESSQNVQAYLQSFEDELMELDDTSMLNIAKIVTENSSVEEIEEEIASKEQEIIDLQTKTQEFITNCQNEIQRIFAEGTDVIPKEVQTKYNEQLASILLKTSGNTSSMQEYLATINENETTAEKAQREIDQKEKEIEKYQKEIKSLEGKDDDDSKAKIAELEGKIEGLNSEIKNLNYIIIQAEKVKENAQSEYSVLESETAVLSESQSGLMDELMADYYKSHSEKDRVYEDSALKAEIKGLENYIQSAGDKLTTNTLKLTKDIEILTKQKALKEQEALMTAAASSSSGTTTSSYSVAGGNYTGDLPVNNSLAQIAQSTAASQNTTGWCLRGVNDSLEKAYGFRLSYNSAYQAIPALQARSDFTEVTNQYPNSQSLTNLPAGAIVVWENSGSHPHGHISIALGNGQEASDHIQNQTTNYGTQYHVFVKTS
ncbi:MAG: hypothetical protein Q4F80_04010 [bacterium]|nr:hypothetical protein [bacterium]